MTVLAFVSSGCGKSDNSAADGTITLQLNWKPEPQFGGFYAAEEIGAFGKRGLSVKIQPGGASAPTVDMLGAGTVDFAVVSADEIVRARANGNRLVALFAVYQTNPQGIMTRASRGFKEIGDVFAHPGTLAMERGLPYSEFLRKKYGFDKLQIVPSPFGDLSLYRTKSDYAMQCFVTSEPLAAKRIGIEPTTFLIADAGYNPYTTVLATTEARLKKDPRLVGDLVEAVRDGWRAYLEDPSKTNEAMRHLNPTMDTQTFTDSASAQVDLIATTASRTLGLGGMQTSRWRTLVEQLKDLNAFEGTVEPTECFVNIVQGQIRAPVKD
jgi:NitT/TauT family transport system substrate-binding protein